MTRCTHAATAALALLLFSVAPALAQESKPASPQQEQFDKLLLKVQTDPVGTAQEDVIRLIEMGHGLGRTYTVSLALKGYLSHQFRPQTDLLLAAANNALEAADYRAAVARYKAYLAQAPDTDTASRAAANLYVLLIDLLDARDDAYQTMVQHMGKFRKAPEARRFDKWMLEQARRQRDYAAWAGQLAVIFSEKMPLEKQQFYFWDDLDALLADLGAAAPEQFDALPALRTLAGQIRGSDDRVAKLNFHISFLNFRANAAGKDEATLESLFQPVAASARSYIEKFPTADTVSDVFTVLAGVGDRVNDGLLAQQFDQKQKLFIEAFSTLSDAHRLKLLAWRVKDEAHVARRLASPAGWAELAMKHGKFFQSTPLTWRANITFETSLEKHEDYRKLAEALKHAGSPSAAVVNAIAEGGEDLDKVMVAFFTKHSWGLDAGSAYRVAERVLWPAWRGMMAKKTGKEPADDVFEKSLASIGKQVIAGTPVAMQDPNAAGAYLRAAWKHIGDHPDKVKIIEHINALAWVSMTKRQRQDVFRDAHNSFKSWSEYVRRQAREKQPQLKVTDELLKQIDEIQAAYTRLFNEEAGDPSKAPNDLCRAWTQLSWAEQRRDAKAFAQASRDLYKLARTYDTNRLAFGRDALLTAVRSRTQPLDNIDLQVEFLKDQMAAYDHKGDDARVDEVMDTIIRSRRNWSLWNVPSSDRDQARKLHDVVAAAVVESVDKGRFWDRAFTWMRGLRTGRGWQSLDWGEDVLKRMIAKDALKDSDYRPSSTRSAVAGYMHLVRYEFPRLSKEFPVETWFDDMFIAEARRTGYFDPNYWSVGGRDEQGKVVAAAADVFAGSERIPLGYRGDEKVAYSRADFEAWENRVVAAESKQRDKVIERAEAAWGKTRFDRTAMGQAYFLAPDDVKTDDGRKRYFERLTTYSQRLLDTPVRVQLPRLTVLADLDAQTLTEGELATLLQLVTDLSPGWWSDGRGYEQLAEAIVVARLKQNQSRELVPLLPHLWRIVAHTRNSSLRDRMVRLARSTVEKDDSDFAFLIAETGMEFARREMSEEMAQSLQAVRSKALAGIGGVNPYAVGDPRYRIGVAQAAYLTGRFDTARTAFRENWATLLTTYRELDPNFIIWIIEEETNVSRFEQAEDLAQRMIQWVDSAAGFDPNTRARLLLSYGDIAASQKQYPRARALYERVAAVDEFKGTRAGYEAQLRIADVDRVTESFEDAIERLEDLVRINDPFLQSEANYHLALVKYDQSEFKEAKELLEKVFVRVPDHALARILEGRVNNALRRYGEGTEVAVVPDSIRRFIVPGRPLTVTLEDRTLAVVGKATNIEIRVWTDSGDEEVFNLMPFGESRTKFRGAIGTELAPTSRGDQVVQLLGNDKLYYDYSENFKKQQKIVETEPHSMDVLTDARLLVSSGRILTDEERETIEFERALRSQIGVAAEGEAGAVALSTIRKDSEIKPGNSINVRVVDPDRSVSPAVDKVEVRVTATSGDVIASFELAETDTHTGIFEGSVPTSSGQALAYASSSKDGSEPNFAISPGEYDAWVSQIDNVKPKWFAVDLNDNVLPSQMRIEADIPGRRLQAFRVQTSLNGRDFQTVGAWPTAFVPWDGSPTVTVARFIGQRLPADVAGFEAYLEEGHITGNALKATDKLQTLGVAWDEKLGGLAEKVKLESQGTGSQFVARFSAEIYLERPQVRTFKLMPKGAGKLTWAFAIDGQVARSQPNVDGISIRTKLDKGLHRLDVYVAGMRQDKPAFEVHVDTAEPPYMKLCDPAMFDKAKQPDLPRLAAAKVTGDEAGIFTVAFPDGARARVIRLLIDDYQGDAPAIQKVGLTSASGTRLLPTEKDFMELRRNGTLEIVPGDKVTISYRDPKFVSSNREQLEAFMNATYNNATISAAFVEYETDSKGNREARYVPMRRFEPGDDINVFVRDPDMDISEKQDVIRFTATASGGQPIELEALETEEHSGVFVGKVFPVEGKPERKSEITVRPGDQVLLTYMDKENTDPGVAWPREAKVEQVWWEAPQLRVYDVAARPLTEEELTDASRQQTSSDPVEAINAEVVPVTHSMIATRPQFPQPQTAARIMLDGPLIVEVLYPAVAKSPESTVHVFAQTSSGRAKTEAAAEDGTFDVNVPGTIELKVRPSSVGGNVAPPAGYKEVIVRGDPFAFSPLDDGRFTVIVPKQLGAVPDRSLVGNDAVTPGPGDAADKVLSVNGEDTIFIGLRYTDEAGQERWVTQSVQMAADAFFDVTDRQYQEAVDGVYIGETIYLRVIDRLQDKTDANDPVTVTLTTTSGKSKKITLTETYSHSGEFKGIVRIAYADDADALNDPNAMSAAYGDRITASYARQDQATGIERFIEVYKGSDAQLMSFTKRFKDPQIGVRTQFTVAEAYFELAKRHRELGQESLARREILQGKKLLEEALRDFPDNEFKAQADYLLANLAMEFADDTKSEEDKKRFYMEAVTKFTDIVGSFPDSEYAPKSQYKKALVYEKMGQIDLACEEYVKLSYQYPDNELVAETIARLGRYFLNKGKDFATRAQAEADAGRPLEAEKIRLQGREMFSTAGDVFARLSDRFPSHDLASRTDVLSAQCYMQAEMYDKAVKGFEKVIANGDAENELKAEAMYWCGDSYWKQEEGLSAYRMFKKLTWDYPASNWARYARGRLADPALAKFDAQ